ncbi:hypothetical protein V6Z12_A09G088100 [Gossypium hirsutum]
MLNPTFDILPPPSSATISFISSSDLDTESTATSKVEEEEGIE